MHLESLSLDLLRELKELGVAHVEFTGESYVVQFFPKDLEAQPNAESTEFTDPNLKGKLNHLRNNLNGDAFDMIVDEVIMEAEATLQKRMQELMYHSS